METTVCKLILLGNGSVGKTSICQRFKDDGFERVYRQTVGLDFLEKKLEIRCRGGAARALQCPRMLCATCIVRM